MLLEAGARISEHPQRLTADTRRYTKTLGRLMQAAGEGDFMQADPAGKSLAQSIDDVSKPVSPNKLGEWFNVWTQLGWLCKR